MCIVYKPRLFSLGTDYLAPKPLYIKSRGEVSLVEPDIIDYVSTAYFEPKNNNFLSIKEILLCNF